MTPEQIQRLRTRLGLTQTEFAQRLNVTLRTVQRWEAGESNPHPVFVVALKELH